MSSPRPQIDREPQAGFADRPFAPETGVAAYGPDGETIQASILDPLIPACPHAAPRISWIQGGSWIDPVAEEAGRAPPRRGTWEAARQRAACARAWRA